jgi:flagellar hook-associated protein 3 FlgL
VVNAVQVSESLTISYGVKADNPAFEQLLRAFNLIANNPGNTAALVEASGLVQQSVDDIANVQGVLSSQSRSIEDQIDKNTQDRTYIKDLASTIKEVDIPSASVYLTKFRRSSKPPIPHRYGYST